PRDYPDRYQEALRALIEAKMKGLTIKPKEIAPPSPVIDLMVALKRSLAQEVPASRRAGRAPRKSQKTAPDRRHPALPLPGHGGFAGGDTRSRSPSGITRSYRWQGL